MPSSNYGAPSSATIDDRWLLFLSAASSYGTFLCPYYDLLLCPGLRLRCSLPSSASLVFLGIMYHPCPHLLWYCHLAKAKKKNKAIRLFFVCSGRSAGIAGYLKQAHSLAGSFCKNEKGYEHSNILRPAIDVSFLYCNEDFLCWSLSALKKKKIEKNFFHHTKSSILKILSKSPRTQIRLLGTPRDFLYTVPHNDFGGLNFKGLVSKYLLSMATSPYVQNHFF